MVKNRQNIWIFSINLEKRNSVNTQFHQLVDSKGNIIRGQEDIRKEIYGFYSKLYEPRQSSDVDL